jgi:hypothetical protein
MLTDDQLIKPLISSTQRFWQHVPPNLVTLIGIGTGGCAWYLVTDCSHPSWMALALLIRWSTDVLDGNLARMFGKVSKLGGYLDTLADALFLSTVPVALMGGGTVSTCWTFVAIQLYHWYHDSWHDHEKIKGEDQIIGFLINRSYLVYLGLWTVYWSFCHWRKF